MCPVSIAKGVFRQVPFIPFDNDKCVVSSRREVPAVALLGADTTIAVVANLYLGQCDLEHEISAVTVATVGLERQLCLGHVVFAVS